MLTDGGALDGGGKPLLGRLPEMSVADEPFGKIKSLFGACGGSPKEDRLGP